MSYVTHARAALTVNGRIKIARLVIDDGWTHARVAERFQVARGTVSKWVARYRADGPAAMRDRSSRPVTSPSRTSQRAERRIIGLRVTRRWGPHRIAYHLHLPQSTVSKVLKRYRVPLLGQVDKNTGIRVRKPKPIRYEKQSPGELVHVDVKKLGRIPDGGGWRTLGKTAGRKNRSKAGYSYLHSAIDDHARLVYSELLDDERKDTAAEFWERANAFYAGHGITVQRVMTDNGSCYRSKLFNDALGDDVKHKYTRPYRPQTNGKIERFHRTLADEWPTPATTTQTSSEQPATPPGSTTTITTDPTLASEASHPSNAHTTCVGRTTSARQQAMSARKNPLAGDSSRSSELLGWCSAANVATWTVQGARLEIVPELTRDLTPEERALLGKLLEGEWRGATQARAQLLTSRRILATRLDLDFDLHVDATLEPIAAPDGILKPTDQLVYRDGVCIGGVMIWIKYGRLASFEYYSLSDLEYDRLPLPTEIRHEATG